MYSNGGSRGCNTPSEGQNSTHIEGFDRAMARMDHIYMFMQWGGGGDRRNDEETCEEKMVT